MARKEVDIGIEGNDGTGDSIRESFRKVNENFTELYAVFGQGGNISFLNLDDTPTDYAGNENKIVLTRGDGLGVDFYELVSDKGTNDDTDPDNTVAFSFDDDTKTVKIRSINTRLSQDGKPILTSELAAGAAMAYTNSINSILLNDTGTGNNINNLVADWNTTHAATAGTITADNIVVTKGYTDQKYINESGDTMDGVLLLQDGSLPRTPSADAEAVNKLYVDDTFVDAAGDTMSGTLYLHDHPGSLAGQGTPTGPEDLQAATKYYVDNTSFASTTNIYVSTAGDDSQRLTPAGKEGRAPSYAFKTINAAAKYAQGLIEGTSYEPGPYVQTLTYLSGGISVPGTISTTPDYSAVSSTRNIAANVLAAQRDQIADDVIDYINSTYPNFTYNSELCRRDVKLIIDSIRLDLRAGTAHNYLSRWAGLKYFSNPSAQIARTQQRTETVAGIEYAETKAIEYLTSAGVGAVERGIVSDRFADILSFFDDNTANDAVLNETGAYYNLSITNGNIGLEQGNIANRDIIAGKVIRGKTSGAIGEIVSYTINGAVDDFEIKLLEPIDFEVDEELEYGAKVRNNQVSIRIESGIYEEHLPIKVPENVSIKGDEFRRTVIRPKIGVSQSTYANTYFYRSKTFDGITTATAGLEFIHPNPSSDEEGYYGRHYLVDPTNPVNISTFGANNPGFFVDGAKLIELNKTFIIDELIAWINATYPSLVYTETKCRRDTGYIIDGIVKDLKVGGREATLTNQAAYYAGAVAGQETETAAAITRLKTIIEYVLDNGAGNILYVIGSGGTAVTDVDLTVEANALTNSNDLVDCVAYAFDANYNPPKNNNEMDVFLCNDSNVIRNVTCQRHGGFMMVLDPEGSILTRSPYAQTCSSFAQSTGTEHVFTGGQYIDGYAGNLPASITGKTSNFRLTVSSPADNGLFVRKPNVPFSFFLGGVRYQVNQVEQYDQSAGTAILVLDESSNAADPDVSNIINITLGATTVLEFDTIHSYSNGTQVLIEGVDGTTELNGNTYYAGAVTSTTITLYEDSGLTTAVNSSAFTAYTANGTVENVIAGTGYAGNTFPVDIFMQTAGNRSMLSNDYTQLNDNGFGVAANNNALAELVSVFTYYCHTGYIAKNGSQIRSLTGNNSYGTYGLVSEGSDPDEVPSDVTLNQDMVFPCKIFQGQYQIRFPADVTGDVSVGDYLYQETTTATAQVSFITNSGQDVYVISTVNGVWNTTDGVRVGASAAAAVTGSFVDASTGAGNIPTYTDLTDAQADQGDLFVFAYDLTGLPYNVSEVEIYHRSDDVYQPYEVTNATDPGIYIGTYSSAISGSEADYTTTTVGGSGATFRIGKTRGQVGGSASYNATVTNGGTTYVVGETFTISGADLGGATPANDVTLTVSEVVLGAIINVTVAGTPVVDANTPTTSNKIWRFNLGTGIEGTAENGLQYTTGHDVPLVFRHKQNFVFDGIESAPTRPSTAVTFNGDPNGVVTYRTIGFGRTIVQGVTVADNQSIITFDSNYDYIDTLVDQDIIGLLDNDANITPSITGATGAQTLGRTPGDLRIAIDRVDTVDQARLATGEMIFTWAGKVFKIASYTEHTHSTFGPFAVITFADHGVNVLSSGAASGLNTFPGTSTSGLDSARGINLKVGLESGEPAQITINISTCRATSHDMLDIGTGGYNQTNYPNNIFGQPINTPVSDSDAIDSTGNKSKAQVQERSKGRVFAVLTDQDGFFRVGRFFTVDQGTGAVTFNAALVLTNIDGIGFKRGVRVNEFSSDDTFTDARGDAVPTQTAVEGYIDYRLGRDRDGDPVAPGDIIPSGGGYLYKAGDTMNGTLNMDNNRITNLTPNTTVADDAATIGYVNSKTDELNDIGDVTITGNGVAIEADFLTFTGVGQNSENATISGDVTFSRTAANAVTSAISNGVIVNADVNASAAIAQSKLDMERSNTFTETDAVNGWNGSAPQVDQSFVGLAAFSSSNFEVETYDFGAGAEPTGRVRIKAGGIANAELANSSTTFSDGSSNTSVALGGTLTIAGTATTVQSELDISTSATTGTITISGSAEGLGVNDSPQFTGATFLNAGGAYLNLQNSTNGTNGVFGTGGGVRFYSKDLDGTLRDGSRLTGGQLGTNGVDSGFINLSVKQGATYNSVFNAESNGTTAISANTNIVLNNTTLPGGTTNTKNLGATTSRWNTVYATVFDGTATEALYADLAENYLGDANYEPGTVLVFGGEQEVTVCSTKGDRRVAGVVTTNPAHLMNSMLKGDHVVGLALTGRVPTKVIGKVAKGDILVTSAVPGYAIVDNDPKIGTIIGKAVGTKDDMDRGIVEVVVGRV